MITWKVYAFMPIANSTLMQSHEWFIEAASFEEAQNIAYQQGARNIVSIEPVKNDSSPIKN